MLAIVAVHTAENDPSEVGDAGVARTTRCDTQDADVADAENADADGDADGNADGEPDADVT